MNTELRCRCPAFRVAAILAVVVLLFPGRSWSPAAGLIAGLYVEDPFTDLGRTDGSDTNDIAWYDDSDGDISFSFGTLSGSDALRVDQPAGFGAMGGTAPQDLLLDTPEISVTLSFTFELPGVGENKNRGFRFGLYDHGGDPLTSDGDEQSKFFNGYYGSFATGADTGVEVFREPGGSGPFLKDGDVSLSEDASYNLDETRPHEVDFILTKVSAGMRVRIKLDDAILLDVVDPDTNPQYETINSIAFAVEGQDVLLDDIRLTYSDEGPRPRLVFFGTGYVPGVSDEVTEVSDATVTAAGTVDIAVEWTDLNGIFLTNHFPHPSVNTEPANGRVIPNFRLFSVVGGVTNALTPVTPFTDFVGHNGSLVATSWIAGVSMPDPLPCEAEYLLKVVAEDEGSGEAPAPNDPQGNGDPIPDDRTIATRRIDDARIYDEDTFGPTIPGTTLFDPFSDGGRLNGTDLTDTAWHRDNGDTILSMVKNTTTVEDEDAIRLSAPADKEGIIVGSAPSTLTLTDFHQQVWLSFEYKIENRVNSGSGFRFGLFDNPGAPIGSDGVWQSQAFKGYRVNLPTQTANGNANVRREQGGSESALFGGDSSSFGSGPSINPDESEAVLVEMSLTLKPGPYDQTTNGVRVEVYLDGKKVLDEVNTDAAKRYVSFNTVAFGIVEQGVILDNVSLALNNVRVMDNQWTNVPTYRLQWSTNDVIDPSGMVETFVTTNGVWPTNVTDGVSVGTATQAVVNLNPPQGVWTNYLFFKDGDGDTACDESFGGRARYVTRYDATPPPAFNLNNASAGSFEDDIFLEWSKPSDPGNTAVELSPWHTYRIYYTIDGSTPTTSDLFYSISEYPVLGNRLTDELTLTNLSLGFDYHFGMTGLDVAGNESPISDERLHQLPDFILTQAVAEVTSLVGTTNGVLLRWEVPSVTHPSPASEGPLPPTVVDVVGADWLFDVLPQIDSVDASDDDRAKYKGNQQDPMRVTGFGFDVPLLHDILGIEVFIEGYGTGSLDDERKFKVRLTRDGATPVGKTETIKFNLGSAGESEKTKGGSSALWDTTWSPNDVNAPGFGVVLYDADTIKDDLYFDRIQVKIYHALPETHAEFDVLYVNADEYSDSFTNQWKLLARVDNPFIVDVGQGPAKTPREIGTGTEPAMRFYRIAQANRWQANLTVRHASLQIYFAANIVLRPGENWVALPGIPDRATPAYILGHHLPASVIAGNATRVSWFNQAADSSFMVTNQIFLLDLGGGNRAWMTSPLPQLGPVAPADDMAIPLEQPLFIQIPGAASHSLLFAGQLPRTVLPVQTIWGDPTGTNHFLNLVNLPCQPLDSHPSEFNLNPGVNFRGGTLPIPRGPLAVDFIYKFDPVNQQVLLGDLMWYNTSDDTWRFGRSGYPLVPDDYIKPTEAILIRRSAVTGNGPYAVPRTTRFILPTPGMSP